MIRLRRCGSTLLLASVSLVLLLWLAGCGGPEGGPSEADKGSPAGDSTANVAAAESAVPADGKVSIAGAGDSAIVSEDGAAAPTDGGDTAPADGGDAAPADGGDAAPADGGDAADRIAIRVGGVEVRVRVSQTPGEKERGLMFTERLPADEGMLFVFEYEHRPSFWMKNTPIDLDVAFIDRRGRIVEIRRMQALDEETIHRSRQPALYALEVNAGWFREHGVTVGDAVEF